MFFTQILTKILLDSSWSTHFLISISQFFCPKSWQNLAKLELFFHFHFPFGVHWRSEDYTTQLPKLWHATSMLSGIASPRFSQVKNALCCVHGALKASWLLCNVAISSSSTCFLSAHKFPRCLCIFCLLVDFLTLFSFHMKRTGAMWVMAWESSHLRSESLPNTLTVLFADFSYDFLHLDHTKFTLAQ